MPRTTSEPRHACDALRAADDLAAFVFTPASLPLFGEGLARYHPLDPRDLALPCFLSRGDGPRPLTRGAGAAVRAVTPGFLEALQDVVTALRAQRPFAERLGVHRRTLSHLGYRAEGDLTALRGWFEERGPVLDADALLRELRAERGARAGEAHRQAERRRGGLTPREPWARARDYLLGGGERPTLAPDDHLPLRALPGLLQGASPRDWDEVQRRALDLVVQVPALLARVERSLAVDDPAGDAFLAWRALLAERGVDDGTVEALAVASWTHAAWTPPGSERSPRAWWILARAGDDLDGLLRRHAGVGRGRLLEGLFHAATAVWQAPPFRAVAEAVLARYGGELATHVLDDGLRWRHEVVAPLVGRHADVVLRGRGEAEQGSLRARLER